MAFSREFDKRDFRKQWNTFSPNQLQNTGDDLPPPIVPPPVLIHLHSWHTGRGREKPCGAENPAIHANQGLFGL
jgi:hypothetical protein